MWELSCFENLSVAVSVQTGWQFQPFTHIYIINLCTDDWINWLKPADSLQEELARKYNWAHHKTAQIFLYNKMLIAFFKNRKAFFFNLEMKKEILYLVVLITKLIDLASCSLSRDWPHLHRSSTSLIFPSKKTQLKNMYLCEGIFRRESGNKVK